MSGLEVLGAITGVLGVLPVAVDALKTYKSILSSIRNADRDLKALIQDLETEQLCLKTTCEVLLEGIVPFSMIDDLIKDPFGVSWEIFNDQLRLRLWDSLAKFERHALDMQKAVLELKDKLNIHDNKVRLVDKLAILNELKLGTSFTLHKKDYADVLLRIKDGNSVLRGLVSQTRGLEISRKRRSQARFIKLIRGLSHSIYQAIRNSTTCSCIASHQVCLELVPRDVVLVPSDVDDNIAQDLKFHVAFHYQRNPLSDKSIHESRQTFGPESDWKGICLQLRQYTDKSAPAYSALANIASEPPTTPKPSRRVRWYHSSKYETETSTARTTQTLVKTSSSLMAIPTSPQHKQVLNLCKTLITQQKQPDIECFGYITDDYRNYELYPPNSDLDSCATVTLRQILEGERGSYTTFPYQERLRVALAISISALHLYTTSWMETALTLDEIIFFRQDVDGYQLASNSLSLNRPFVVKKLSRTPHIDGEHAKAVKLSRPIDLTIFSLGNLLIQVMIGKSISSLDIEREMNISTILSKRDTARQYYDKLIESGGLNYKEAVEWCFDSVLRVAGLHNDDYCQQFYQEVVSRIKTGTQYLVGNS